MLQAKKINTYIILGIFIFSFCFFLTTLTNNTGIITNNSNQKSNNIENNPISLPNSQSNSSPYNASSSKFYTNETCDKNFDWTAMNNSANETGLTFATPSKYNSYISNLNFSVMSTSVTNQNVQPTASSPLTSQRLRQAQSFNISTSSYLKSVSIYIRGKSAYNTTLQIRNQWNDTAFLYNTTAQLSSTTGWMTFNFSSGVYVNPGIYYVWMDAIATNGGSSWAESNASVTTLTNNTMNYNGTDWNPAQYRLTLIVSYSSSINPSNVNMTLNGLQIMNGGSGKGYIKNFIGNVTGSYTNLTVSANSSIYYSYMVNASYFRFQTLTANYSFIDSTPNWNMTLNLDDPSGNYTDYNASITGFNSDYSNIQIFEGNNIIAYSRPDPGTTIIIQSPADFIIFQSPNYISKEDIPQTVYPGASFPLNISARGAGNITIAIYSGSSLVYFNSSTNNDSALFTWNVTSNTPSGNLNVNITFFGDNEVGYFAQTINLIRQGVLNIQPIDALSLQSFKISCSFKDEFTGIPIQNASVTYSISNITGTLNYDTSGDYSQILDSNIYSLMPGEYNLTVTAQKSNYQSISINSNVTIGYRPINILLSRSSNSLHPGNTLNLKIGVTDNTTKSYLERPINLDLYIVPAGSNSTQHPLMFQNFNATTQDVSYSWIVPKDTQSGNYNILVKVQSDYYSGSYILDDGLTISPQTSLWYLIPIVIGVVILATGTYFQRNRIRSRHSVKGIIILHENGSTLAQKISRGFGKVDPTLISSAVTGIISIIQEITGKGLRTLAIEGGYVNIARGNGFWLILFMEHNPSWIKGIIRNCVSNIEKDYGEEIVNFKGKAFPIDIDGILMKNFHVTIYNNPLQESLKKRKKNSYGY